MNKKLKIILIFLLVILIILVEFIYEVYISYNKLRVKEYSIETNQISNSVNLVIISDLHDNQIGKNNKKLVDKINSLNPGLILVVGDVVNSDSKNSQVVTKLMKQLCKNYKVFYSLGNSDIDYISAGTSDLVKDLENIGVIVLDNEYEDVSINDSVIRIGGMYDYAFGLKNNKISDIKQKSTYDFLCDFENTSNYKIMMAHRPDSFIFNNATKDWDIDLVVSGHTHGGQVVLPFVGGLYAAEQGWIPKYDKGLFDFDNTKILITSGLGSGKEILPRFNNIPQVVNLKLW